MSEQGALVKVAIRIQVRWWVAPYVHALHLFAFLVGQDIDEKKLADLITRKGLRITSTVL